jgi:MFS family permease
VQPSNVFSEGASTNLKQYPQLSLFLAALDFTIATTATPTIINELHSATIYTWIGSAYLLASAASTPVWAKFSDIFGRRIILLAAVAIFFVGSAICASSNTTASLIAGRSVQGAGAGGMIILTNICISDLFSMRWVVGPGQSVLSVCD